MEKIIVKRNYNKLIWMLINISGFFLLKFVIFNKLELLNNDVNKFYEYNNFKISFEENQTWMDLNIHPIENLLSFSFLIVLIFSLIFSAIQTYKIVVKLSIRKVKIFWFVFYGIIILILFTTFATEDWYLSYGKNSFTDRLEDVQNFYLLTCNLHLIVYIITVIDFVKGEKVDLFPEEVKKYIMKLNKIF